MLDEEVKFVKLAAPDLEFGKALRWPLFNGNREQVYPQGGLIPTQAAIDELLSRGVYRRETEADALEKRTSVPLRPERRPPGEAAAAAAAAPEAAAPRPARREAEIKFENTRIRVGDLMQFVGGPNDPKYTVALLGYQKGRGLIVSQPESGGGVVMLRDGQTFTVRFFSGLRVFSFTATVLRQTAVPFPHMFLTYPKQINHQQIRKSPRIDVSLIASVDIPEKTQGIPGRIYNLSTSGIGLRTKAPLGNKGEVIRVKFKLEIQELESVLNVPCEICSVMPFAGDDQTPLQYGLSFLDVDNNARIALSAFVFGQLLGSEPI